MGRPVEPVEAGRRRRWRILARATQQELESTRPGEPLLAQLLRNRGLLETEAAERFLAPASQPLAEPELLADLPAVTARVLRALASAETIAVYGDYDVDGLSGTALLTRTLRFLAGRVLPFVPDRERDGYGLRPGPLAALRQAGASLIVTVDCGVSDRDAIAAAAVEGLEIVVTDHHRPPPLLPPTLVVNPGRPDCRYPFKELAGAGVAYRLAEALLARGPRDLALQDLRAELVALAALGTVADGMPLVGENRALVGRGLLQLGATRHPGLRALLTAAGVRAGPVDVDQLSYGLVPRLNAAGRLGQPELALELLLSDCPRRAAELAGQLEQLNQVRRERLAAELDLARGLVPPDRSAPGLVLSGPFSVGLLGLLATRLAEEQRCTVAVLRDDPAGCVGSVRAHGAADALAAVAAGGQHLVRYGGHARAAGLTVEPAEVASFAERFLAALAAQPRADRDEDLVVDAELSVATAGHPATLAQVERLAPFGPGNRRPTFLVRGLRTTARRVIGRGHVRLELLGQGTGLRAVGFGWADDGPTAGRVVDLVVRLRPDRRADRRAELELVDWRPSVSGGRLEPSAASDS